LTVRSICQGTFQLSFCFSASLMLPLLSISSLFCNPDICSVWFCHYFVIISL
jgi:hypothetical protein